MAARAANAFASASSRRRKSAIPSPVTVETGTISAPSSPVPASRRAMSRRTSTRRASGTASTLVSATTPRSIPRRSTMARCSTVCGMTPSSAATTSRTKSMPVAPASMLRTNFSWPGTSTKPSTEPSSAGRYANPRSIEMPRSFSSLRRSVSTPVSARTSVVLPWSIWPAVPMITSRPWSLMCSSGTALRPSTAPLRGSAQDEGHCTTFLILSGAQRA